MAKGRKASNVEAPVAYTLSPFQQRAYAYSHAFDLILDGGKGGGKTELVAYIIVGDIEANGDRCRVLVIRRTYKGLSDIEDRLRSLLQRLYPGMRHNAAEHVFRLPNGAYVELGQLEVPADLDKYAGRSFTRVVVDEAGQYGDPSILDRLRGGLRAPEGIPTRFDMTMNPGAAGHGWICERYVFRAQPWLPFVDKYTGREVVRCPSTYKDNPFIDQAAYLEQLRAATPDDPELFRAYSEGDWTIKRGAFFAGCLEEERNAFGPWNPLEFRTWRAQHRDQGWYYFLAHDFGVSAPSCTYVVGMSGGGQGPDGRFYPKDSALLIDELATDAPGYPNAGLGWTIPRLAEEIRDLAKLWGIEASGCADDACFSRTGLAAGSISDEFAREGVRFRPAKKGDRKSGWQRMRTMLSDAGKPDRPGLYVSRGCTYFWRTVPFIGRDPRRAEDLDSREPDHAADCARYALGYQRNTVSFAPFQL